MGRQHLSRDHRAVSALSERQLRLDSQSRRRPAVLDRDAGPGFRAGSSIEAVNTGWLYPLQPYTIQCSTFHVPTVESTLLRTLLKRERFQRLAPFLFLETVQQTIDKLVDSGHLQGRQVGYFLTPRPPDPLEGRRRPLEVKRENLVSYDQTSGQQQQQSPSIEQEDRLFAIDATEIIWPGLDARSLLMDEPADEHPILVAVFLRVNGANAVSIRLKAMSDAVKNGFGSIPPTDATYIKLNQFMQRHLPLAMELDRRHAQYSQDAMDLDDKDEEDICLDDYPTAGGKTQFIEDRDFIETTTVTVPLEPTPFERLTRLKMRQGLFEKVKISFNGRVSISWIRDGGYFFFN